MLLYWYSTTNTTPAEHLPAEAVQATHQDGGGKKAGHDRDREEGGGGAGSEDAGAVWGLQENARACGGLGGMHTLFLCKYVSKFC